MTSALRVTLAAGVAALTSAAVLLPSATRAADDAKKTTAAAAPTLCAVMGKEIKDASKAFAPVPSAFFAAPDSSDGKQANPLTCRIEAAH